MNQIRLPFYSLTLVIVNEEMFDAVYVPKFWVLYTATLAVYGVPETAANVWDTPIVKPVGDEWLAASLVNPPCGLTIVPLTIILVMRSMVALDAADWV